ncbi:MAG TPA: penicillin-binding transpeptidase domain-containing protein [Polyangiaceae bacterium]|nr:penicillin-binding transpeptidase domain-containing protein [Polyangiaceae bacterium]
MRNLNPERATWVRRRMGLVCGLMGLGCGLLISSAYRLQVEHGREWRDLAEAQRQRRLHVAPKRGTVYDRNGVALAVSVEVPSVSADAFEMLRGVDDARVGAVARELAQKVGRALHLDPADLAPKLASRRRFVWLKRRVSAEEAAAVKALGDPRQTATPVRGLQVEGEGRRYYPNRELAGPLLGFVSPDGEGKEGLELELDDELKGRVEALKGLRDRSGRLLFAEGVQDEKALAGHNVVLSLDQGIQYAAEQELASAVRTYEAAGGSVVVTDPHTGEVLALASSPTYNPNDYAQSDAEARRNRAIHDRFEPGSTMKVFTLAAALAEKTLSPTQKIFCERGVMAIDNVVIHDTHVNEWLTPTQVLAVSSNIGAAKIGLELGETRLYEALRRFGFGEETGVPLPGEASGVLRARGRPWVQVETASASFGQGVSVTSLQLAMALGAVANGGKLMEPMLVRKVTDGLGNLVSESSPKVRREALPAPVARTLSEMLVAVTEGEGTGVEAALPGFSVAGKTATAQKADPATGQYTHDRFTSSFIGFVPADKPRVVVVVVLDEPMINHAGGAVAAPAFRRVAEAALRTLGVLPRERASAQLAPLGPAAGHAPARPPTPPPPWRVVYEPPPGQAPADPNEGPATVPSLLGLAAREAIERGAAAGLVPAPQGVGVVVRQEPAPGASVARGTPLRLLFEPPS